MNHLELGASTSLQRRRALEEERKSRILDDKTRIMGLDLEVLNEQVAEKKRIREYNKEKDEQYAHQMVQLDVHCCRVEEELKAMRRQKERDLNAFRKTNQREDQRREWDLQDPKSERHPDAMPIRLGDDDPRLGTSSAQVFVGEEITAGMRKKAMQEQMRRWTEQQVDERDMRKWAEKEEQRIWEERDEEMTHKAHEIQKSIDNERRRIAQDATSFNRSLGYQKKAEDHQKKYRDQLANMTEIQMALDSDLLTESRACTLNVNDPTRFRIDHMKGLLPHQRQAILDEQKLQQKQLAQKREEQAAEQRGWEKLEARQHRVALLLDRQREREKRQQLRTLADERLEQAAEAAERQETLRRLYANEVTEAFQGKFGASMR